MRNALLFILACNLFVACSISSRLNRSAQKFILTDSALQTAHVGISIYEPATDKWWYNYQADKYFVPASNVKLATCYAAMKYLGDSLVGLRYRGKEGAFTILPTGDPTFLHPDFKKQPVFEFFKTSAEYVYLFADSLEKIWQEKALGSGWSWDDYNDDYMVERSPMPMYGNVVTFTLTEDSARFFLTNKENNLDVTPGFFKRKIFGSGSYKNFGLSRSIYDNNFEIINSKTPFKSQSIPFITNSIHTTFAILNDTLTDLLYEKITQREQAEHHKKKVDYIPVEKKYFKPFVALMSGSKLPFSTDETKIIHSQPTDSILRPMMHRSDNFFAEQSLLMVSNERLGFMNDEKIIDTILKTDFKDLPQKPRWVDGSGLSRYNLFTPQDFVTIIQKMKTEFGTDRVKNILPTGNEGTFVNYFKAGSTAFYAKTGSLSGVATLSGFLITKKGKELIFSVLVNNHQASTTRIRRAVEKFIQNLRNKY